MYRLRGNGRVDRGYLTVVASDYAAAPAHQSASYARPRLHVPRVTSDPPSLDEAQNLKLRKGAVRQNIAAAVQWRGKLSGAL